MMYSNKFVASIKVAGKILREYKDKVYIPYGSEYSLLLKNMSNKKAIVHINIDNKEVVPGGLVVSGFQTIDIERFVENLERGARFKFIERTLGIEQHRGIQQMDGLISVRFEYETERTHSVFRSAGAGWNHNWPTIGTSMHPYKSSGECAGAVNPTPNPTSILRGQGASSTGGYVECNVSQTLSSNTAAQATCESYGSASLVQSEVGITVPGSESRQTFVSVPSFPTDGQSHVLVFQILGEVGQCKVEAPVTVKTKVCCDTCGKGNAYKAKFCAECGTSLAVYA